MNCPHCGAKLLKDVSQCPFCGREIHAAHRHFSFGNLSLSCAFAGIVLIIIILVFFRLLTTRAQPIAQFLADFVLVLSALSIVFGSIAFFGKARDVLGLIGMMLGICFLIILALTFSLANLVFFKTGVEVILPTLVCSFT